MGSQKSDRPAVGIRAVLAAAAATGRRYWARILVVAVAVSLVTAVAEILVDEFVDRNDVPVAIFADLSASVVSLLGAVFLSGFICKLASAEEHDADAMPVRQVLRALPWARLIGADLLVALLVAVGLLLLVLPGLIAINLFGIVGPVIEIENRPVIAALRRSARLVRSHFWTVALLVTVPVVLSGELDALVSLPDSPLAIAENLAIRGIVEAVVEAAIALVVVKLGRRLMDLDRVTASVPAVN